MAEPGETLDFSLHRSTSQQREHYDYSNDSFVPPSATTFNNLTFHEERAISEFDADYALPPSKTRSLKLGYAFEQDDYRFGNVGAQVDPATGAQLIDPNLTSDFKFRQQINAAYASYQATKGAWTWLGGLRAELTHPEAQQMTDRISTTGSDFEIYPSREQDARVLTDDQRAAILALTSDFPRLWRDLATPDRERKRMVRLLLEDVTLSRNHQLTLQIRFKGGAHKTLNLPLPLQSWQKWVTPSAVVNEIDQLLDNHTVAQIAAILNERGIISGAGRPFHPHLVARLVRSYGLKPRYDRLREAGLLTLQEMANALQISPCHVKIWNRHGLLHGHAYSDKNECLYEPPGPDSPRKAQGRKLSRRRPDPKVVSHAAKEVQCET